MEADDPLGDEGRKWINSCVRVEIFEKPTLQEYTRSEAIQRIRECFSKLPSSKIDELLKDPLVLPERDENGKSKETFTILDISEAVSYLDTCTCKSTSKYVEWVTVLTDFDTSTIPIETVDGQGGANYETTMAGMPFRVDSKDQPEIHSPVEGPWHKRAGKTPTQQSDVLLELDQDKCRAVINKECKEAKEKSLEHGTGFIISDHLSITSYHVIMDTFNKKTLEICISNKAINKLPCEVIDWDPSKDLALLYCKDLNLKETNVLPLPLCAKVPLQSQGVFIFGYPFTYFGKSALFFKGYVSGCAERYGRPPFMVLYCSVCPGSSGSPVFYWMQGQLNVVAVLAQRHKKDILAIDERNIIEDTRRSLEQSSLKNYSERSDACSVALKTVTIQLCDAVEETHCQFGLCNAVPGNLVTEFIENTRRKLENACYRNELDKVVVR